MVSDANNGNALLLGHSHENHQTFEVLPFGIIKYLSRFILFNSMNVQTNYYYSNNILTKRTHNTKAQNSYKQTMHIQTAKIKRNRQHCQTERKKIL